MPTWDSAVQVVKQVSDWEMNIPTNAQTWRFPVKMIMTLFTPCSDFPFSFEDQSRSSQSPWQGLKYRNGQVLSSVSDRPKLLEQAGGDTNKIPMLQVIQQHVAV